MRLIDTHTHLFSDKFDADRDDTIWRALEAGVERMYLPNICSETTHAMKALVSAYPKNCFAMMGLHPCHVGADYQLELEHVAAELASGQYCAIGETGLDYHWDLSHKRQQQHALQQQITWAKQYRLPLVLHTRESFDDTCALIEEQNDQHLSGVFHCFGGSSADAARVAALGDFYLGIGGVATFRRSPHAQVLPKIPLDLIVLETDSPYLAPVPHRGKRNESAYLPTIAREVARIMQVPVEQLAEQTTANALKLFNAAG